MQTFYCLFYRSLLARRESLEAFQTSEKRRKMRSEMKKSRRMMRKRRRMMRGSRKKMRIRGRWRGREGVRRIYRTAC